MPIALSSRRIATRRCPMNRRFAVGAALSGAALLALPTRLAFADEPTQPQGPAPAAAPTPTPLAAPVPFAQAVSNTANLVLTAAASATSSAQQSVVIDPLVDGVTGAQSRATSNIQTQIMSLVQERYPQF